MTFWPKITHKAILAANGSNFGKSIISKYLRAIYDLKNKKNFWPILKFFFIPSSLQTTRNNRSSPQWSNQKNFSSKKSYYLCITSIEIVQNSKSKPKKFSVLCSFKLVWRMTELPDSQVTPSPREPEVFRGLDIG